MEETGQGAAPWTVSQLNQLTAADVKMCQKALGSMMTDSDKLSAVWSKLKEVRDDEVGQLLLQLQCFIAGSGYDDHIFNICIMLWQHPTTIFVMFRVSIKFS